MDLERIAIIPRDRDHWLALRHEDLTSTEISALFGVNPYESEYELWHRKRGPLGEERPDSERMRWGRRLEGAIAQGWADDNALIAEPMKQYMRLPGLRIGSSFDYRYLFGGAFNLVEVKTVDPSRFKDGWTVDGDFIEAPAHIELQVQQQLLVSGYESAVIVALVGGNRVYTLRRQPDAEVHDAIIRAAHRFWCSEDEPVPNMPRDAAAVIRRLVDTEKGRAIDADPDTATNIREYASLGREIGAMEDRRAELKARILMAAGTAERLRVEGFSVSCGYTRPSEGKLITPEMVGTKIGARDGFRNLRVTEQ